MRKRKELTKHREREPSFSSVPHLAFKHHVYWDIPIEGFVNVLPIHADDTFRSLPECLQANIREAPEADK
ncbi:hypothetical protein AB0197_26595, partial [Klebsiella pneumoniae]